MENGGERVYNHNLKLMGIRLIVRAAEEAPRDAETGLVIFLRLFPT